MSSSPQTSPAPADSPDDLCRQGSRLEAFLAGSLAGDEAAEFSLHLDLCPSCLSAAEVRVSRAVWSDVLVEPLMSANLVTGRFDAETDLGHARVEGRGSAQPIDGAGGRLLADRYELRGTVGMGGCGAVFSAWDRVLRRDVAVKSPHWQLGESDAVRRRFAVEARAAARLSHPNIVPVYEARIEDGDECFLVSELIRGPSLLEWQETRWLDGDDVAIRQAALLMAALADGVEFAHAAGVLHRDLKPSNVMLAPAAAGELPFTPRITDFGLARLSGSVTTTTADGKLCGSLPYMAPEQITGGHGSGPASDIYALGVILYELLTGDVPIQAETPPALIAAIPVQSVPRLRGRRSDVPRDLEAICLKCLEKLPGQRYATAAALAADLRRFLAGEVITARLPHAGEQAARWIARHPAVALVMTTIALAATAFVIVLAFANEQKTNLIGKLEVSRTELQGSNRRLKTALWTADEMRRKANRLQSRAEHQQLATQERLYVSEFRQAMLAWEERDLPAVQRTLDRLDGAEFSEFRGIESDWLRAKLARPHREVTRMHGPVYAMTFSPDGQMFAVAGKESIVRLGRYADGTTLREWPTHQLEVNAVAYSPDGRRIWTTGDDGSLCQWDVATGEEVLRIAAHAPKKAFNLLVLKESDTLVSVGSDGRACFWHAATGQDRGVLQLHDLAVSGFDYDSSSGLFFSAGKDQRLRTWSADRRELIDDEKTRPHIPITLVGMQDSFTAVVAESGPQMRFWHPAKRASIEVGGFVDEVKVLVRHPGKPLVYAIDAGGVVYHIQPPALDHYAAGLTVRMRDDAPPITRLHSGRVHSAVIDPDQSSLVTCGDDGAVRAWPLDTLKQHNFQSRDASSFGRMIGPAVDGTSMIAMSDRAVLAIDVYDLSIKEVGPLASGRRRFDARLSPDGTLLWIEQDDSGQRWLARRDPESGNSLQEVRIGSLGDEPLEIEQDAHLGLLVVGDQRRPCCHVFTMATLEPMSPLRLRVAPKQIAIGSRASLLAVSQERRIEVYHLTSRNLLWAQPTAATIEQLLFYEAENCLLSVTGDRVIRTWDAENGRLRSEMIGHRSRITSLQITPDGRTLITGSSGGEVMFWHLPTGELLGQMDSELNGVHQLCLSPRADRLLNFDHGSQLQSIPMRP